MSEIGVNVNAAAATAYAGSYGSTTKADSKAEQTKKDTADTTGAVYEKTSDSKEKATYSINKMSAEKRAELVKQMKADQETRQNQLIDIVNKSLRQQASAFTQANGDDVWKTLAKGGFSVDQAAREKAQELISEDGYYGVKQTAQRIFDFASALAGDDVDKMKEMQAAFEKGYKQATKAWGKELPSISSDTRKAVNDKFDEYYDSKKTVVKED